MRFNPPSLPDPAAVQTAVFVQLGGKLGATRTVKAAAEVIAEAALALFRWDAFNLMLVHRETYLVEPILVMDTLAGWRQAVPSRQIAGPPSPMTRRTLEEGPQLLLRQTEEDGVGQTYSFGDQTRRSASLMNVPVQHGGRAVCVLSVQSYTRNAYTPADLQLLTALAEHAAGTLDRLAVERELGESERRFQAIVEQTPYVSIQTYDRAGRVHSWNSASHHVFGWTAAEALGRPLSATIFTAAQAEEFVALLGEIERTGQPVGPVEFPFRRRNGSSGWCLSTVFPIPGPAGDPLFVCMDVDITARRQAEQAHQAEADFHRAIVQHAAEGLCVCHAIPEFPHVRFTEWNEQMTRLTGYSLAEINTRGWYQTVYPDPELRARAIARMDRMRQGEDLRAEIWPLTCADGQTRLVQISTSILQRDDGLHVLALMQDVTERTRAEQAFRASEARFRAVAESLGDGLVITTLDDIVLDVNPRILALTGRTREEVIGQSAQAVFGLAADTEIMRERNSQRAHGHEGRYQLRIRRADGSTFWADITGAPLRDAEGQIIGTVGVARDITEQLAREQALRASEARLRAVVDTEPECVKLVSLTGQLLEMNPAGLAMLEVSSLAEACAQPLLEWLHPEHRAAFLALHQRVAAGGTGQLQFRLRGARGTERWVDTQAVPLRDDAGQVTAVLAITRDVTERLRAEERRAALEEQLRQAQKVEAIGTLAGGIAHDFNNILGAIVAYTEIARLDAARQPELLASLDEIKHATHRAKNLVRQILTFSRRQPQSRKLLHLRPLIEEALRLLRPTLPATLEIEVQLVDDAGPVLGDSSQLHQILINLATNAAHAIGLRPGRLTLELRRTIIEQRQPDLAPGPHACLTVADTGCGMDAATLARIFVPFFTTKPPGEGTGLGLAVVHGIVKDHAGTIRVHSEPGIGTTFELYFPIASATASAAPEPTEVPIQLPRGHGERILFVDDEPALCASAATILLRLGYAPTTFTVPTAALAAFRAEPEVWSLVITDLTMPGMTGMMLAEEIFRLRPTARVLLATGFSGTWTPESIRAAGLRDLLPKPFDLAVLAHAVHTALHPTPRP